MTPNNKYLRRAYVAVLVVATHGVEEAEAIKEAADEGPVCVETSLKSMRIVRGWY